MHSQLFITNYCDIRSKPLHSITRLSENEVMLLAADLSQYAEHSFTSYSRFKSTDFPGYYQKRIRTEKWLYDCFLRQGGKPINTSPLYFVLGESTYLENWFRNGIKTQLLLDVISPTEISFTIGDSMAILDTENRLEPLTKESLFHYLSGKSDDIGSYLNELNTQNRYIEAQLWNDAYLSSLY